jgi:hypothetical protein
LVTQLRRRKTSFANTKALTTPSEKPTRDPYRHPNHCSAAARRPRRVDDMNDIDAPIKMRGYEPRQPPRGGGLVLDQQQFHGEAAITIVVRHLLPPIGPVVTVVLPPNASLMRARI